MQLRFFCILLLVSAVTTAAAGPIQVVISGEKTFFHTPPVLVGSDIYVPMALLNAVGAKGVPDGDGKHDGQKVDITPSKGSEFSCQARLVGSELMLPLDEIAPKLGVLASFDQKSGVLTLRATIDRIEFDGSSLRVETSYPVTYEHSWWGGANKLILDVRGVRMPANQSALTIENSTEIPIRTGVQDAGDTGRIVLDFPAAIAAKSTSPRKSARIALAISEPPPGTVPNRQSGSELSSRVSERPAVSLANITGISYRKQGANRLEISVSASASVKYVTSMSRHPAQLVVDISNSRLSEEVDDVHVGQEFLEGIRVAQSDESTVRLTMDLTRVVSFEIRDVRSPAGFALDLELPKGAGGLLSEKTVVIDAGHGGHDPGAVGLGGWREKDSNLAIARRLQKVLTDMGVAALMTRSTDVALDTDKKRDLEKRASFAKRHSADIFVSVHSNSVSGSKCPSGIMTFYHGRDASGAALAQCVHTEMIDASGLPCQKVRSDFSIYQTGFGVLRGATGVHGIPAILLEIGYVKHPGDVAKLKDPAFQQKMAEAVARGLKAYVEGEARTVKPSDKAEPRRTQEIDAQSKPVAANEPIMKVASVVETYPDSEAAESAEE